MANRKFKLTYTVFVEVDESKLQLNPFATENENGFNLLDIEDLGWGVLESTYIKPIIKEVKK